MPADSDIGALARDFLGRGGKRLRPKLCAAVYRALMDSDADAVAPLGEALERLHKATLVHDDIQDGDEIRYGRPALWREYGVPVAIAVGDWLVADALAMIADAPFPSAPAMLRDAVRTVKSLCEGQGDELLGRNCGYLSLCARKTGALFALAAALGARAAGADPEPYRRWGELYGTLFQLRDDRNDGESRIETEHFIADAERRLAADPLTSKITKGGFEWRS